jgi:tRNA A-37 threonylcarbamoyl transferase component Bud32
LPPGALGGLCPKCLLAAGLESDDREKGAQGGGSHAPTTPHSGSFVPPDAAWLATHFPQLEILELLGHGGMGAVYKARQPRLDRLVALKIIRPESADDPAFAERFNREARMLARLSHPHIVAVYDFGEVEVSQAAVSEPPRKLYFFLMEYVEGTNLRQLLQMGELTPQQALAIVPQICEALQFAHDEGIVHRDIKPENILLDKRGRVKIADFGLAKLAAGWPQEFTLTGTHQVMGTPRYMAPEQMEGSHAVDHRADIYSLGVVFYEMLTGEVPMGHFEPPSKKVEVDVRLDEVVLRTLAREPQRRYQHASDLKSQVECISRTSQPIQPHKQFGEVAADDAELGAARQQVQLPVVGLLVMALFNLPLAGRAFLSRYGSSTLGENPEQLLVWLLIFVPPLATLVGAVKMLRLSSYRWSIAASLLVMLSPAVLEQRQVWWIWWLCVLIGVWSLVVLNKPEVKKAFSKPRSNPEPNHSEFGVSNSAMWDVTVGSRAQEVLAATAEVRAPAIALTAVGVFEWIACWAAAGIAGLAFRDQMVKAMGSEDSMGSLLLTVLLLSAILSTIVIIAGLKIGRFESYAFCIFGSIVAMLISPGNVIGLPIGIWSLYILTRPEVKAAFGSRTRPGVGATSTEKRIATISRNPGSAATAHDERGDKPPDSRETPPGTLRRAWDDWWAQRDRWITNSVQAVLCLVFVVCLIMYLSFQTSSERGSSADSQWQRHTTVTIGVPDPWFDWETYPDARTPFQWKIDWVSTSTGIMLIGFVAWCVNWQIEKAKAKSSGKKLRWWHGSPNFAIAFWAVATLMAVVAGIGLAELPQRLDGLGRSIESLTATAQDKASPGLEQRSQPNDDVSSALLLKPGQSNEANDGRQSLSPKSSAAQPAAGEKKNVDATRQAANRQEAGRQSAESNTAPTDHALFLDGQDDFVEIPSLSYDGSHPITIELWAKPASDQSLRQVVLIANYDYFDDQDYGICLLQRGDKYPQPTYATWAMSYAAKNNKSHSLAASAQHWRTQRASHIAFVATGRRYHFYIDGRLWKHSQLEEAHAVSEQPFMIGGHQLLNGYFHGTIDEVRLSRIARYRRNFTPTNRLEPDKNTIALYHCDEGRGDTLGDSSGNGHDGKINGAKWILDN